MNCGDVDRLLSEGMTPQDVREDVRSAAHVRTCPRCAPLLRFLEQPIPDPGASVDVEQRIRHFIQADLSPVRPVPSTGSTIGAALLLAFFVCGLHSAFLGIAGLRRLTHLQMTALYVFFIVVLVLAAVSFAGTMRPAARQWVPPLVPVLLIVLGFPAMLFTLFPEPIRGSFFAEGITCLVVGMATAGVTAAAAFRFARRGYSTDAPWTGALIGVVSAVVAMAALQLSCPDHAFWHLVIWHGLPVLLSVAGGYWIGLRGRLA